MEKATPPPSPEEVRRPPPLARGGCPLCPTYCLSLTNPLNASGLCRDRRSALCGESRPLYAGQPALLQDPDHVGLDVRRGVGGASRDAGHDRRSRHSPRRNQRFSRTDSVSASETLASFDGRRSSLRSVGRNASSTAWSRRGSPYRSSSTKAWPFGGSSRQCLDLRSLQHDEAVARGVPGDVVVGDSGHAAAAGQGLDLGHPLRAGFSDRR